MCGWPPARKDFSRVGKGRSLAVICPACDRGRWPPALMGSVDRGLGQARGVAVPHDPCQVALDASVDRGCHHACSPSQVQLVQNRVSLFDQRAVSSSRPEFGVAPRAAAVKTGRRPPPQAARSGLDGGEHGVRLRPGRDMADPAAADGNPVGASSPPSRSAPFCWRARRRRLCAAWW